MGQFQLFFRGLFYSFLALSIIYKRLPRSIRLKVKEITLDGEWPREFESLMIEYTKELTREMGFCAVFLCGDHELLLTT